jgi:inosine-uridine nucleoside N-ribohydrolase
MVALRIYGDPKAADVVFTAGMNTLTTGIILTTQVIFNDKLVALICLNDMSCEVFRVF